MIGGGGWGGGLGGGGGGGGGGGWWDGASRGGLIVGVPAFKREGLWNIDRRFRRRK